MYVFDIDSVRRARDAMDSKWKEFMRGFVDIVEDLEAFVIFMPAEGSKASAQ